jgi:2-polyprenyl-3-methyl-5-hydroxy-6-metoxy-1,4-benzoquinol methylase
MLFIMEKTALKPNRENYSIWNFNSMGYYPGMSYIIESTQEGQRLELQNALPQYCILEELRHLDLELNSKKILDAGCGTGSLARIIACNYQAEISGCDTSDSRIAEAQGLSNGSLHYFKANLVNMPVCDNHYDVIFIRFVLEHTLEPHRIIQELTRILKPGGHLVVIDLDGLIFNLHHQDEKLGNYLTLLHKNLPIDLYIGRKLPRMLKEAGLELSECHVQPMLFQDEDLEEEIKNMQRRFAQSKEIIQSIIGAKEYDSFLESYMREMRKSQVIFCNKFIVSASKS